MSSAAPTGRERHAPGGRGTQARRRAERLRAFAEDAPAVPILIHRDPDPDAVASAAAVAALTTLQAIDAPARDEDT